MIVFVGAVVIGATGAFFSDTETSTGNTFTAGAIDLQIDNESYYNGARNEGTSWTQSDLDGSQFFFNFNDLKPGDWGEDTISIHVNNNDAYACVDVRLDSNDDNGLTEPEAGDGDETGGEGEGELANAVHFYWWADDGDNVYEEGEQLLDGGPLGSLEVGQVATVALAEPNGGVFNGPLQGDTVYHIGKAWCFGDSAFQPYEPGETGPTERPVICDGAGEDNITQTDSLTATISFYAEQARNNGEFICRPHLGDAPEEPEEDNIITQDDLALNADDVLADPTSWFFYNDTNDTLMTINQFSGNGGVNEIVAGPDSVGSAKMVLHSGEPTDPRYNIATSQFGDTLLSDISSLKYRIYDASASSQAPYLHFNIDFFNTGAWQGRLVQVPTGVVEDTWTTVDALGSTWTKTSGNWPDGDISDGTLPGSTARTWADILADYPDAETNTGVLSWFGIRVGHPGPVGEESYVDWVEFDGQVYDFEN